MKTQCGTPVTSATLRLRRDPDPGVLDRSFTIMKQDLLGYAFYSSFRDLLNQKAGRRVKWNSPTSRRNLLAFSDDDIKELVDHYRRYLHERLAAFELNFIRIMGLTSALRQLCQVPPDGGKGPWWLDSTEHEQASAELRSFVDTLASVYTDERLSEFRCLASDGGAGEVRAFLRTLPENIDRHRANTPLPMEELRRVAERYVREEFGTGPLTCLGGGQEGIVLTDGQLAYKYFHDWRAPNRGTFVPFLQSLAGRLSGYRSLPNLLEVRAVGHLSLTAQLASYPGEVRSHVGCQFGQSILGRDDLPCGDEVVVSGGDSDLAQDLTDRALLESAVFVVMKLLLDHLGRHVGAVLGDDAGLHEVYQGEACCKLSLQHALPPQPSL